jgi:hypothetical protein
MIFIIICSLAVSCNDKTVKTTLNATNNLDTTRVNSTSDKADTNNSDILAPTEKEKQQLLENNNTEHQVKANKTPKKSDPEPKPKGSNSQATKVGSPPIIQNIPKEADPPMSTTKPDKPVVIEKAPNAPTEPQTSKSIDHGTFDNDLRKYVDPNGKVNYASWLKNRTKLDAYINDMAITIPSSKAPLAEKMAYWINVYNANTIKLVLDNYPISSITKIDGGKPWDSRFVKAGSTFYSLNEIEKKILIAMGDPRIHFAVNCAAKSCPKLLNKAYTAENLEASLTSNTLAFLSKNEFVVNKDKLIISKIFEWYNDDFGDVKGWIGKKMGIDVSPKAKIIYKDYNWDLNN